MLSWTFWLLTLGGTLGYACNNLFLAHHIRSKDAFSVGIYRNLSFGISFLPVLYFIPLEAWQELPKGLLWIQLSAFLSAFNTWGKMETIRRCPLGTFFTFVSSLKVLFTILLGILFFGEWLTAWQVVGIGIVLWGMSFLIRAKKSFSHLVPTSPKVQGLLITLIGFGQALSFFLLIQAGRTIDPLMTAYVWEFSIGIWGLLIVGVRRRMGGQGLQRISWQTFGKILLAVCPTVIGTSFYLLAGNQGPMALVFSVGTAGIVFVTLMAHFFYHEKLTPRHWLGILISLGGLIVLKLLG